MVGNILSLISIPRSELPLVIVNRTDAVLEIKLCLCEKETCECSRFRFMICNLGFEL